MLDSRRENACFSLKWGICKEKTRDFCLNGGFEKTHDFRVKWGISEKKTRDFRVKWKIPEEKMRVFCVKWGTCKENTRHFALNGGFSKRKRDFRINV